MPDNFLTQYNAIIFDWDGTLVDTCGLILDAHNHVRVTYGETPWTMNDFLGRASKSAREYYPEVYGDKADEAQKVLYQYVEEHHLTHLKKMEHCDEILSALDMPLGIVSNKRHNTLHIEINHLGVQDYFKTAIGAGHAEKDKPDPAPLFMAMSEIHPQLKPEQILYVGDTETDLLTAKRAGCDVALVQSDKPRPDLIEKYAPKYAWDDLKPLLEALKHAA